MNKTSILFLALAIALGIATAGSLYRSDWMPNYESKSAADKMTYLWGKITADRNPHNKSMSSIAWTVLPTWLGGIDFALIGNVSSDQIPSKVVKGIHANGHTAKGKFVWNSNTTKLGLTGSFKQGNANHVVARFSNATGMALKHVPNVAFKFLRSGVKSGNMFGSHSIEAQKSTNWFDWGKCNNVHTLDTTKFAMSSIENKLLMNVFSKAGPGNIPTMTGVSEVANYDESGKPEAKVNSPFTVCFQPTKEIHNRNKNAQPQGELYGMMSDIPKGTKLYEVYAIMSPIKASALKPTDVTHIGHFELTESPTPSKFGDEQLFFKHTFWQQELISSGKKSQWSWVDPKFLEDEGVEKYEKFFKKEHQINVGRKEGGRRMRMVSKPQH